MLQPYELTLGLPIEVANGVIADTADVWSILDASYHGDLDKIKTLAAKTPELLYAQYNYAPPIHFAVRERHIELVKYLLDKGAYDPAYKTYPFLDNLLSIASERGHDEIALLLKEYATDPSRIKYSRDNGAIHYKRTELEKEFEKAVDQNDLDRTSSILSTHPEFALDKTFFWSEGILLMPAKENHRAMIDLLISYGATIPNVLKWTQRYYFEHKEGSRYMMEKGMNPNTMSWQRVTILHDMAQKANIEKAELLLRYGAKLNMIDDEYQSTPLGIAARWGKLEMVKFLVSQGADIHKAGASWSKPLAWAKAKKHPEIEAFLSSLSTQ